MRVFPHRRLSWGVIDFPQLPVPAWQRCRHRVFMG